MAAAKMLQNQNTMNLHNLKHTLGLFLSCLVYKEGEVWVWWSGCAEIVSFQKYICPHERVATQKKNGLPLASIGA